MLLKAVRQLAALTDNSGPSARSWLLVTTSSVEGQMKMKNESSNRRIESNRMNVSIMGSYLVPGYQSSNVVILSITVYRYGTGIIGAQM